MEALSTVPNAAKSQLQFAYDYAGRRIQKIVSTWNGTQYVTQSTNRFVYDGWNLIAVLDSQLSILQSFRWGLDLSGQGPLLGGVGGGLQGAGGVGGLLSMTVHTGPQAGTYFYSYDGNGNLMAVVTAADESIAAQYEYGPFGELFHSTGPMAKANSFRFSTKYQDDETDFLYYGFRYYNPSTGRWLTRDPIEENGGLNVYGFVGNTPQNYIDRDGRDNWSNLAAGQNGVPAVVFGQAVPLHAFSGAPTRAPISAMAKVLTQRIDSLEAGDFRRLFLDTQQCILDKLSKWQCCMDPRSLDWLNRTVKDFMDPMFEALDGRPNTRWADTFRKVASYQNPTPPSPNVLAASSGQYVPAPNPWSDQMFAAREMAMTHIDQDLRQAIERQGVGSDGDWSCIGKVVSECERKFFNGFERLLSRTSGLVNSNFDIAKFRDSMRDDVKSQIPMLIDPYHGSAQP
jgi:RHS repeat-associated protein